jgi:anthranilate phosphoribosyltransferase
VREIIEQLCERRALTAPQIRGVFRDLVDGALDDVQLSAFLVALRAKGETTVEVAAAADALRDRALPFPRPTYRYADIVGTGGDGAGTINISTAAALVCAAAGLPIAKHGNRAVSSRCGAADLLEQLGVKLDPTPATARRGLDQTGFCFLFAPQYHAGTRHAMPVRTTLGTRTVFNLLGPLVNPARPRILLVGVYRASLVMLVAGALAELGASRALVVHGGGLDEIALHAPTTAAIVGPDGIERLTIDPAALDVTPAPLADLVGGTPADNATRLTALLRGDGRPADRDAVALNAGATLWLAERAEDLRDGVRIARRILEGDGPMQRLRAYAEISQGDAHAD